MLLAGLAFVFGAASANAQSSDTVTISLSGSKGYENHPDRGNVPVTFTATLDPPAGVTITVDYRTFDIGGPGQAKRGEDYQPVDGTLTFAPGETSKTVEVVVIDDDIVEDEQQVRLSLINPSASSPEVNVVIGTKSDVKISSEDRFTLLVDSPDVNEGQSTDSTNLDITLRLSNPLQDHTVAVAWTVGGGTAAAGDDYTGPSFGTYQFRSERTERTVTLRVNGDDVVEDDETVMVTATVASVDQQQSLINRYVTPGGNAATGAGTIRNDDHTLSINSPTVIEKDSGTRPLQFSVTLTPASHQTIEVGYGVTGGTATAGTDFVAIPTDSKITFSPGQSSQGFRLPVRGDTEAEEDETVEITLTNLTATAAIPSVTGTGTIQDDEPTVSRSRGGTGPTREGDQTFIVVERFYTVGGDTLHLTFEGTATVRDDYQARQFFGIPGHVDRVNFEDGDSEQELIVFMKDDDVDEEDETVVVSIGTSSVTLTISDHDDPPEVSVTAPELAVTEGAGDLVFPVALSRESSREIAVSYTLDGTATAGADYTDPGGGTVTFAPGETRKTITLTTIDDLVNEPDAETVELTLTAAPPGLAVLDADSDSATATINDNEPLTRVWLETVLGEPDGSVPANDTVTEGDGFSLRYAVRLEPGNSRPVTVMYTLGGSATAGADYTDSGGDPGGGTVTFAPGETRKPITLTVTDDDLVEWGETVSVTLSLAPSERAKDVRPSSSVNEPTVIARTIRDNDLTFSVDAPGSAVAETAGAELVFTVTLSAESLQTITVPYGLSGTATAGADYTDPGGGSVTFAPGETRKPVMLIVTDDNLDEEDETVVLTVDTASASATIADRDDPPEVSVEAPGAAVIEGNESLVFPVRLSHPSTRRITVSYTLGGTTDAATDYTAPTPQVVTFEPGAEDAAITLPTVDDFVHEPDETVEVTLVAPASGLATLGTATAEGTIRDDEPTVSAEFTTLSEGSSVRIEVARLDTSSRETFDFTFGGTATKNDDYHLTTLENQFLRIERVTLGVGQKRRLLWFTTIDDEVDEENETVVVAIGTSSTTVTIRDLDDPPEVSVEAPGAAVIEGAGDLVFPVALSRESSREITVSYTLGGTATEGEDYATDPGGGTVTFAPGETRKMIALTTVDNAVGEPEETVVVTLSIPASSSGLVTLGASSAEGAIWNNEYVYLYVEAQQVAVNEGARGTESTFTFDLVLEGNVQDGVDYTWDYAMSGTATHGGGVGGDYFVQSPHAQSGFGVGIPAGTTRVPIRVTVLGDNEIEEDETVVLTLSNPQNARILEGRGVSTATIQNDDHRFSIDSPTITEGNSGTTDLTFTVTLDPPSSFQETSVDYATSDGEGRKAARAEGLPNRGGDDYEPASGTLVFPAGASTRTITITVNGDGTFEFDDTMKVALSNPDSFRFGGSSFTISGGAGVGTIENDDILTYTIRDDSVSVLEGSRLARNTAPGGGPYDTQEFIYFYVDLSQDVYVDTLVTCLAEEGTAGGGVHADRHRSDTDYFVDETFAENPNFAFQFGFTLDHDVSFSRSSFFCRITIWSDDESEPDETLEAYFYAPELGLGTRDQPIFMGTATILNDDHAISVDTPSVDEGDEDRTGLEFTVTLDRPSTGTVTVDYEVADGTATAFGERGAAGGHDFEPVAPGTLTFEAGETEKKITVQVSGDETDEPDETVLVTLSGPVGPGAPDQQPVTSRANSMSTITVPADPAAGTILNDDPTPTVSVEAPESAVTEGETLVFPLTLSNPSAEEITVHYALAGSATAGADYEGPASGTVTFAPGDSRQVQSIALTTLDDEVGEQDETVEVTLSLPDPDPGRVTLDDESTTATGTILDNDLPLVTVAADAATVTEGEDAVFVLTRERMVSGELAVTFEVTDDDAVLSGALPPGATFAADVATVRVPLATEDDQRDEPDATLKLTLTDGADYDLGTSSEAEVTVEDNDDTPTVTLVLTPASIGEAGGKSTVTATLDRASSEATTVTVAAAPVTPAVAGDYTLSDNLVLTIPAGDTDSTGEVTLTAVDNDVDAEDKEVTVSATAENTQGVTAPENVTLTITDDDAPALSIGDASVAEGDSGESATLTFTVTLSPAATLPVTVDWKTADGTAEAGTDYTAGSGSLRFDTGEDTKTVTVTVTGDDTDEPNETLTVTLSDAPGATLGKATATGTITDDDDAPEVTLVLTPPSIGEAGGKSTVTATLDHPSSEETTVTVATAPVTPTVPGDYTLSDNLVLTIPAGDTDSTGEVTLTAVNNDVDAEDKEVTVSATAANDQGITNPQAVTLTITDDDAPELSIGDASVDEGNAGESATLTFTMMLTPAATLPVTVEWATADGTAEAGTDYTAANGALTFNTGEDTKTVTVTVTGDDTDEPNETLTVTLSNAPGATLGKATGTGTITDDDDAPTVTLVLTPASITETGGKSTVTATLDHPSSEVTTVTVTAAPVDPAVAGDYTLSTNTTLTIAAGETTSTGEVTITAVNNDVDAEDKEVTVSATAENTQGITAPQNATLTIEDDDAPALSVGDASVAEGDAGESATLTFTVTLSPAATLPVTVDWKTADGTATAGTDYTAANGSLRFDTGEESKTLTVTVTGDDADEPNETLTVTLSNESGATLGDATATGTITDDDDAPTVTLVLTPASITENGGKSTVTATLDRPSSEATTVTVSAAPVTPAVAGDYALSANTTLTIPADSLASTGVVTITAADNAVDAADKTVTVSATATNTQGVTAPQDATLTITDDDAPSLSIADASVAEGNAGASATMTFTVTLTPAATLPVTVDWQTADGTATAGTDYTAANGTLTFNTGDETKTVTVTVTGDDTDEPNETLTVTLSNESGATLADATGTGTITDDDDAPTVTLVLTPASIGENGGKSTVTATLDHPSSEATTVTVAVAPVDPAVPGDYTLSDNLVLTIPAGDTDSTGEVTIIAVNNDVDALDKEVTVSATATNAQGITAPQDATLTITDDDAPSLSIGDASVAEGDAGTSATLTFTVSLTPAATLPVTVDWQTADGTATAGTDYTEGNGTLTFNTGDASKTIAVTVTGDDADEPNETLTVTLSNAPGATLADATATGTITDDDDAPTVTLVLTPASIGENGGKSTVTATLNHPSSEATTVTVSTTPVSPTVSGDYTLSTNKTLTIPANSLTSTGVVTITAVNNDVDAEDKEVTVSATAANSQGVTAPQDATLTITDDDAPSLSIGDASVAEGDAGTSATLTFTVTLDPAATLPVTVDWATSDGTAEAGTDYTAANGSLTFETGDASKTVTVTVTGDDADEPNETLTVTLSNAPGATLTDATATGTITDDDDAPKVTLVLTPVSVSEDGGKSTVTATLDHPSSEATTVTVTAAPVSPAVANDYTLSPNTTLTIPANSLTSTGVVTITAVNNDVDALDKRVTVSATATNAQGITAPQDATLTITDDDAPSLSIDGASVAEGDAGTSATLTFTVSLTPAATLPVTVDWKTADGTATAGTDYTAANGSLTFETGDASKTVEVTVTGDEADEPNETLTVTLSNESGATLADATATGTITDDDGPPAVTLVLTPASITENAGKSTVTATLNHPSSEATTVTVSAAPVDPAVANDYMLSTNLTLTIPAHSLASTGEVTITAVNNDVDAEDKEVTVSATAANDQGITNPQAVTLTITDDDAPALSIADASVAEGDAGESATLTFTVTLTPAATLPVTVEWATADGTATAGTDYTAGNGTLTFNNGEASKTVTVTVTGDDTDEPNETLTVTLSNAPGATLGDAAGTGTITDDDDAPTVTLVLTPVSIVENGGKSTVTATLDHPSTEATTVTVSAAPVDPAVANDYTLSTNTTLTIPANSLTSTGEVTITAVNNDVDALDKEVTVSATAANDQGITAPQDATLTIEDDDAPALSIGDASVTEGDAGDSPTLTFTVTLSPAATLPVTVDWKTADGTATAGTDYTAANGSLRFGTGEDIRTITVTVTGDDTDEPNETFTVTLSNAPGATFTDATATGTITDDDDAPTVTLVLTPASVSEDGGKSTVTATLDHPSSEATTVTVSAAPVSPAVSGDYTLSTNTTLTIPANSLTSTGVVTLTAVDNDVDALDKGVTVSGTAENDQGVTAPQDATLTITDDDMPALSIGDARVAEGDSGTSATLTFTVTLSPAATLPVTVDWKTTDGTATAGTDYTAGNGSLRFGTGENSKTVTVTVTGDDADEPNETFTVTLSNAPGASLAKATATGTITDDDGPPAVTLVLTPASVSEDGGKSTVTATLDRPSSAATTMTVSVAPVDPAVANDYTLSPDTTLTIAVGETTSTGEVTITAVDNDVDALNKEVTVSATATNTQGVTAPDSATLTITDDDAPALSIADASVAEGDSGDSPTLTFTVTLTPAATLPVTVDWKTADGTATAGTDYTAANGTLTFSTGDESKTIPVTVTGDDADEPNETLTVTLSNAPGATLSKATGTGTITDDDGPPTVTLVLTPASITEAGGKSTVTATLDHASSEATTVTVSAVPLSPAVAGDYTLSTNLTLTIPAHSLTSQGLVTITAADNTVYEGDKAVTVSGAATNDQGVTAPQDATLTLTEDDTAPVVTVAAETAAVTEGEDAVFVLTRASADVTTPLAVDFTLADPDTVLDQEAPTTATIPANETTVRVVLATDDDSTHEPDATLTLTLTDGDLYDLGSASSATVTVRDNEPPGQESDLDAAVTVAADRDVVTEGESAVFTLTRVGETTTEALVVTIEVSGGDGVLVGAPPTEATFGAGVATTQVTLATVDDEVDEPNAVLTLTVLDGDDYYPGVSSEDEVTVRDDDDAPTVTLVLTPASIGEAGGKSTVTAELDVASSEETTVTVTVAPVSPAVASDYTLSDNLELTFAAGETTSTGEVTITAVDNDVDALDKGVTVSGTAENTQGVTAPQDTTLTITDDDAPALSIGDASVGEGDSGTSATLTFTVTLSPAATLPVTVDWKTADGTATAGTDYTAGNGSLRFDTGENSKTITVTVTGDDADEPNETFTVTLSNAPGATLGDATGTGTITDDDGPPAVTLVLTPDSIVESGGVSTVTATLDHASSAATTVTVTVAPVDPAVSGDYTLSTDRVLTIPAHSLTSEGLVTITAVNNDVDAADKEVTVSATATNAQGVTAPQDVTLTIEDDDAPSLSIADASVAEGNAGTSATLTFTVTLDPAATLPVTVDWRTADGTATAGTDYTAGNGTLTFESGDATKTVAVTVMGDDADEPNETLTVTLSNESGATLADAAATGTITDDDGPPAVTLVLTPASIGENGGKSTVTATLNRSSSAATTVTVSAAPVSPALAGDYTLSTNTTLTIAAGQTASTGVVTITAVNNDVDAADKEVTVSATATNAQGITAPQDTTLTITDDDAPALSIGDASVTEGDSGTSATLTFTVTLDPAATLPVTVDWKTADGTATAGADYTAGSGTLTFESGDASKTVTVTVTGDDADEPNETLTVTLSNESGATITDATATGTITDDDGPPAVTLVLTPASISENGGSSTVTATLNRASSAATTVTVSATPVSPALAGDYTLSTNTTLTIPADSLASTGVVTITAVNNDVDALDKEVTVSGTAENTQGIAAPQNVTLTITDDDAPALSIDDASVAEGNAGTSATLTFTVTLAPAATLPVTVDWQTADGTAEAGTDYTAGSGTLTFESGDASKTVEVTVTGDDADEPNETLTVTLSNESGATLADAAATGTITDDDGPPAVTLVLTPASIGENGGSSTVTATLDRASSAATTVTVSATPVSPALAGDYTLSTNTTLTIAAGQTASTGVVTITAVNNDVDAADKEVTVSATATNAQGITAPQDATLTITDDDAPSLSIADASVAEGNAGTSATLTFTVTLDPAATLPVTVDWRTADGTATAGTDYTAGNGTLTFESGDATKTVAVTVMGDDADEPNETLTVTLSNESGATLADAAATGTITDDDGPPAVTLVLTPASISENGGKSTVTATLNRSSSAATTVTVSATPVSPALAGDYTLSTNTTLTIAAGQTASTGVVTITAVDNSVDAADKTVTVSATATNAQGVTAPQDATLTITDDDAPSLSIADASVTEGNAGTSATLTFTVTLDPAATLPVTVDWQTADGTAEAGTDYTAGNGTLTFESGDATKTVAVTVMGDDADEPNETLTVTLSNESGATLADAAATGTITDDDGPPAVTLVLTPASIGENGGKSTVTATLDRPSSAATTVTVATTPVAPAVSGDYTLSTNKTLTIPADSLASTGTVTITAVDNSVDAADKTVTVSATATNGQGITAPQDATLTITDDDLPMVTVSVESGTVTEGADAAFTLTRESMDIARPLVVDFTLADPAGVLDQKAPATATIPANGTTVTVTLETDDDNIDELDATLTLTLGAGRYRGEGGRATVTVRDNDGTPELTVADATASESADLVFTLSLNPSGSGTVSVRYAITPDTAQAGDYTGTTSGTVTFTAGETSKDITLDLVDDTEDEPDETVTLTLSGLQGTASLPDDTATGTIEDNDQPLVTVAAESGTVTEGADAVFVLTRAGVLSDELAVAFTVAGGGAVLSDAPPTEATFDANADTVRVALKTTDDQRDEPDATLTLTLTDGDDYDLGASSEAEVTVEDNDATPAVTLNLSSDSITEAGGKSTVTATLDRPSSAATTVTVMATPVSPAVSNDYTLSGSRLTIAAGETTSTGLVTITAVNNDVDALDKTVTVSATATNTQGVTNPDSVTLTITDDDAPTLSIGDASVTEGDTGESPTMTFTVTLTPAATLPVTVDWKTADGTAEAGTDYTAGNGTLSFGTGEESKTITVTVTGDDVDEPNETITVTLANASGATIEDATGTGTITDDDGPPAVTLVLTPASITEDGGKSTVTATLDRSSSAATTVTVSAAPVTPAVANDYTLSGSRLSIAAGETTSTGLVTITAVNNDVDALDKTVTVSGTAVNDQGVTNPDSVTLTITDDDAPALSVGDASVTESDAGESATMTFTVTLAPAATLPVTVDWKTADGTATAGTDYTAGSGSLTFGIGEYSKTFTVTVAGDEVDEPNETFTVTLSNESGATLGKATGTGTITDDDLPLVTVAAEAATVTEGADAVFVLTRVGDLSAALDVTFAVADTGPVLSDGPPTEATFNANADTVRVTLATEDDEVDEPAAVLTLTLFDGADHDLGTPSEAEVTVEDNDDDPPNRVNRVEEPDVVVTVAPVQATVREGEDAAFTLTREGTDIAGPLVVSFTLADPAAVLARSQEAPTTATIPAGQTTVTVTLATEDDLIAEPDARVVLTLRSAAAYRLGEPSTATVVVRDNDGLQVVTVRAVSEPAPGAEAAAEASATATATEREAAEFEPGRTGDMPATVTEGEAAVFELRRTGGDVSAALTVDLEVSERSERGGDMVPAASEGVRRVTFAPGDRESRFVVETVDDGVAEPDSELTVAVLRNGGFYEVGQPGTATLRVADAGGVSVLAQGRRAGAGALLRRHVERFSQLTSDVALGRLAGGRRVSTVDLKVDDEGVSANGEIAVALPLEWDGWGSLRYSDLGGTADGEVWDVYAGADYLSADGRTAYGVLTGYEPGRVTAEGVRLKASHMQFGVYGAHRLNETLTVDGALGWGRGRGKLSLVEGAPVTASYRSERIAVRGGLTGDFGWGGEGLRVEPQVDLLYAEEDLGAFTDDMGGEAPGERLWLARLGFGPRVTVSQEEGTTHGKLRVNLDTHNLESNEDRTEEVSASVEVGHRWQIDEWSSLDVSVSVDGLGSDWFSSGSVGLRYELSF